MVDAIKGKILEPGFVKISILNQLEIVRDAILARLATVEADLNGLKS